MQSYHGHRTVLSDDILALAEKVVSMVRGCSLHPLSHGSSALTARKQRNLQRRVADLIKLHTFNDAFMALLLTASLNDDGKPTEQGMPLYSWLLTCVYAGNVQRLYADWLEVKREE